MPLSEAAQFIYDHALPEAVDIEAAKGIILEYMSHQSRMSATAYEYLITAVRIRLAPASGLVPPGYISINVDLNELRAELAAREAIQQLHGQGALIGHGQFAGNSGATERPVSGKMLRSEGAIEGVMIPMPEVQHKYSLAAAYLHERFLLADGDIYLSQIDRGKLPSRVRRCLKEAVSTFQHGDYLSVVQNLGAASESLWLRLAQAVNARRLSSGKQLMRALQPPHRPIGELIDLTWPILTSDLKAEVKPVLRTDGDREPFIQQARDLRERRNYALHDDEADEDEAMFRYNETGVLLLASVAYFNHLIGLLEKLESSVTQP